MVGKPAAACRYLMVCSMLGSSYTFPMVSMPCSMASLRCSRVVVVDGTLYWFSVDCCPLAELSRIVSVF